MKIDLTKLKSKILPASPNKVTGGSSNGAMTIEKAGEYIQKNIRRILCDEQKTVQEIPNIKDEHISSMTLEVLKNKNIKTLLLGLKSEKRPEIAFELSKGTYEQIINEVDQQKFIETFTKKINSMKACYVYS